MQCQPLDPVELIYLFSKISGTLIDGSENATVGGDLNFGFRMLLKGAVSLKNQMQNCHSDDLALSQDQTGMIHVDSNIF